MDIYWLYRKCCKSTRTLNF